MNKAGKSVSDSRRNKKKRLVYAMGGKCCICGYNKCFGALEFHHKNKKDKEGELSHLGSKRISVLLKEAKKCILVCSNCHREIHAGLVDAAKIKDIICYDEVKAREVEEETYRNGGRSDRKHCCEKCGKPVYRTSKICNECNMERITKESTFYKKFSENGKEKMIKLVRKFNYKISEVAKQLKVSELTVRRYCKKLDLPTNKKDWLTYEEKLLAK